MPKAAGIFASLLQKNIAPKIDSARGSAKGSARGSVRASH